MPMLGWTKNMKCMTWSLNSTPWPTGGDAIARRRDGGGDADAWADQEHDMYGMELEE